MNSTEITTKIILIGQYDTRKSSIIRRFIDNTYEPNSLLFTIGANYNRKIIPYNNSNFILEIWDVKASERNYPQFK